MQNTVQACLFQSEPLKYGLNGSISKVYLGDSCNAGVSDGLLDQ